MKSVYTAEAEPGKLKEAYSRVPYEVFFTDFTVRFFSGLPCELRVEAGRIRAFRDAVSPPSWRSAAGRSADGRSQGCKKSKAGASKRQD